jgi:hypothetical protein
LPNFASEPDFWTVRIIGNCTAVTLLTETIKSRSEVGTGRNWVEQVAEIERASYHLIVEYGVILKQGMIATFCYQFGEARASLSLFVNCNWIYREDFR